MSSAGGNQTTTITINGNASGAQAALASTSEALGALSGMLDATSASAAAFADATTVAGGSAVDMGAALDTTAASADVAAASMDTAAASTATMGESAGTAQGMLAGLTDGLSGMVEGVGNFIEHASSFVTAIAAWSIIQDVIGWVQQLSSELFNLEVQTEKAINGWQYLFGSKQNATDLANWTSKFSLGIPFTRQDLLTATTTMGAAGMTPQQVEQFMPYLSDIAATYGSAAYGGRGTTLAQSAQAVRMFREGMSRMLKYDLNISPEQLIPYGLVGKGTSTGFHVTDPNSVFRALENFAKAKHLVGASGDMTQTTWWGGFSSAQDQIQNLLLSMGGTDLSGNIRPGSFFASIKQDLFGLLDWFNTHQAQLTQFSDTMSQLVGTVVDASGSMLGQFFTWLGKISSFQDTMGWVHNLSQDIQNMFLGQNPPPLPLVPSPPAPGPHHPHPRPHPGQPHPGGAGGPTIPNLPERKAPTGLGIDWANMPVVGGLLHTWSNINWGPISQGLSKLGDGWSHFASAFGQTAGPALAQAGTALGNLLAFGLNGTISMVGNVLGGLGDAISILGQTLLWTQPVFDGWTQAFGQLASVLQQFITAFDSGNWSAIISTLEHLFGISPGGNSGGGGGTAHGGGGGWWGNLVPPGAFRAFGSVGSWW